jgi:hypothetical protein
MPKTVVFLSKTTDGFVQEEASRSALGTMLKGHEPSMMILDVDYDVERGEVEENLEWIIDSDGIVVSNNSANAEKSEYISEMSLEEMAKKMLEYDVIVPY